MKPGFLLPLSFVPLAAVILLSSCKNNGQIPYNEENARKHIIPIKEAKALQRKFIDRRSELGKMVSDTAYLSKRFNLPNAESFNRDIIALLLNQPGAEGIRIYYGDTDSGKVTCVLLPIDKNGKDIIRKLVTSKPTALNIPGISSARAQQPPADPNDGDAGENGQNCPPCEIGGPY